MEGVGNRDAWERQAENWLRWARTPGHDAYWYYRDAFFDGVVPSPGHLTVEVGCGEGRVTRDLEARGHRVVSIDGSPTLLHHARLADPDGRYVRADAGALALAGSCADVAVAYNSLMDFDDMPGAVAEVGRVLAPGGVFCACVTHPVFDAGVFEGDAADAPCRIRRPYLGSFPFEAAMQRNGITMHFTGWSHSLERYVDALSSAGLVLDAMHEPVPTVLSGDYARFHRYPMFLFVRALRR